ncbi:MAG: hypothetical protein EOP51_04320 [Sphingobacteriales bacterium]|nr:MAG: hypothetical protein EOP51_04320 [Sphingobacteriales bacterium]
MRVALLLTAGLLAVITSNAQTDSIYLHNGTVVAGKVYKVAERTVVFSYENEEAQQSYGKYAVDHVVFGKSGRVQPVTNKVVVHSKEDWERVLIIENAEEIAGLQRRGEVKGKTAFVNYRTGEGSDKVALKKIKMDAAAQGCGFVCITTDKDIDRKSDDGGGFGQVQSIKKGIGFSY